MAETLDLVCGPADPLPESSKSFRLLSRLGSGGQADVYKAVRQSGGISSAPVSLKVFRPDRQRPLEAQYRSWDKGDAVHMDLDSRGVTGICRRIDAFYGPPPHRPDAPAATNLVPYQVLEYLPGSDLKQLLRNPSHPRVQAISVLRTIAGVLDAMHRPNSPDIHPALHMDIKPSNVIVMPSGEARVIDFTGARYSQPTHMTTISYTPEAAGPEARAGRVGPSYDVHGFGAVAFYLVTGTQPRIESATGDSPSVSALRRHPVVEANPRLRDHLLAPLSDDPRDRPPTSHLDHWIGELATLMRAADTPDIGVDWGGAPSAATRRPPAPDHREPATAPDLLAATGRLPQTMRLGGAASADATPRTATIMATASVSPAAPPGNRYGRGVAVPTRPRAEPATTVHEPAPQRPAEPRRPWRGPDGKLAALSGGGEFSIVGAVFAFICWGVWAFANQRDNMLPLVLYFVLVLVVAGAVFAMARLVGTLVLVRLFKRNRRTARLSHLAAGVFLVVTGIGFLSNVAFIANAINWLKNLL
ncbi:serine/threonine protein kinase [Stackebrandtia albiflava]|uniref:Serine/threonine protein kinase n=1 Tax=Stackebrandtia albiflava TaxID=406432 RepID=A0A562VC94_9ACTN|nr:hypothetical protein [Stackebrandtia albiflava]TWJ15499.1 serine/threonine protein kinase [Stackebrandtia albiflava]